MLLIICVERLLHIGSHFSLRKWRRWPHFPTKLVGVASFSYKIGSGSLIFLQNWRRRAGDKDFATLLAVVLTWSGYWYKYIFSRIIVGISLYKYPNIIKMKNTFFWHGY